MPPTVHNVGGFLILWRRFMSYRVGVIAGDGIGGGLAPKVGFILVINDSGTDASLVRGTYTSSLRLRSGDTRTIRTPS